MIDSKIAGTVYTTFQQLYFDGSILIPLIERHDSIVITQMSKHC